MNFSSDLVPTPVLWVSSTVFALVLYQAVVTAPWVRLRDNEQLHVFLGSCICVMLLWTIRAGILTGLGYHLLAVTILTLMFEWRLAIVAITLVIMASTAYGAGDWSSVLLSALVMGVLPIATTQGLLLLAQKYLPNNIFVYVFVNAFFAAGVGMLVVALATAVLMGASGAYSVETLIQGYLLYLPLFCFPEAFINGILMTVLTVYRPQWVSSFDDQRYLRQRKG